MAQSKKKPAKAAAKSKKPAAKKAPVKAKAARPVKASKPKAAKAKAPRPAAKKPAAKKPVEKRPVEKAPPARQPRIERATSLDELHPSAESALALVGGTKALEEDSEAKGRYVYCVVRSDRPMKFGKIGLGPKPEEVSMVTYRDLAAVVSEVPMGVLDPTRENVLAHQQVTERVMRDYTVLPMSFGTVFKTDDDIVELLKSAYDAFGDVLQKMQDKFEFGLKVLWDREEIIREIEQEDEDLRRLKAEIASQKGSTYFARMQYGRAMDAALQARSERYVAQIFEMLRDVSVASRTNKPIGDKMIMNAAFLVSRDKETAFDEAVRRIGAKFEELTFKYTGPWPAYNFVNIRLKLERAAK